MAFDRSPFTCSLMCIHMCACTCVYTYIYIHIHMHTHTYMQTYICFPIYICKLCHNTPVLKRYHFSTELNRSDFARGWSSMQTSLCQKQRCLFVPLKQTGKLSLQPPLRDNEVLPHPQQHTALLPNTTDEEPPSSLQGETAPHKLSTHTSFPRISEKQNQHVYWEERLRMVRNSTGTHSERQLKRFLVKASHITTRGSILQ